MLRILTAGESHGPACVTIVEGMPAGVKVRVEDINQDLKRRHSDFGRGGRGKIEEDKAEILSGIRYGKTLGSHITLIVKNLDFANWRDEMRIEDTRQKAAKITTPRPGHADLAGALKYGQDDIRNISERASARETVGRVMAGAIIRKLLQELGIRIASHTIQIGSVRITRLPSDFEEVAKVFATDPDIRCLDQKTSRKMKEAILEAGKKKDTLGGVVEVIAAGAPVGLGCCSRKGSTKGICPYCAASESYLGAGGRGVVCNWFGCLSLGPHHSQAFGSVDRGSCHRGRGRSRGRPPGSRQRRSGLPDSSLQRYGCAPAPGATGIGRHQSDAS